MLKIYINSERIKLFKDTSISLNLNSQLFTKKTAYSFPFKIPKSENEKIMGYMYDLGIHEENDGDKCYIEHGTFHIEGVVYVTNITKKFIELKFIQKPLQDFYTKLKETKINEIEYEEFIPADMNLWLDYYNDPPDLNGDHNYNWALAPVDVTCRQVLDYYENKHNIRPQAVIFNYRRKIYESEPFRDENFDIIDVDYIDGDNVGYGGVAERNAEENYDSDDMIYDIVAPLMPFWRLKFVVQKIAEYLNYTIIDNCIQDDTMLNNMLIFSLQEMDIKHGAQHTDASFTYLPGVTFVDFFKILESDLNIITVFNNVTRTVSFVQKKDIINSEKSDNWSFPYRILNSKLIEKENYKYIFEEQGEEVHYAKENGVFQNYDTGSENQKKKKIISTSLPSQVEAKSDRSNNYYIQGWYTYEPNLEDTYYKTIYAKYDIPHAIFSPNGPMTGESSIEQDHVPKDQPLRFLIYNYDYSNKERREYARDADNTSVISSSQDYTGEAYNFAHYRFYDNNESLDAKDDPYTALHENFFLSELTWINKMKRAVVLKIDIPSHLLNNFDFLKKRIIGNDKFLFKDISLKLTTDKISVERINAFTVP